jgi:catechol 2,3-dioxygenase-like lactoylglutathione lyase family enzyme
MAKVIFGNHSAVVVPRQDRDRIRKFYRDVLGCKITRELDEKDDFQLGDAFYIAVLYGDFADESEFLRSGKSIYLELKSDNVEEMRQKIVDFGVRVLEVPDPHLYFQAPGGQVFRLVGINEDLSKYVWDTSPSSRSEMSSLSQSVIRRTDGGKGKAGISK